MEAVIGAVILIGVAFLIGGLLNKREFGEAFNKLGGNQDDQ